MTITNEERHEVAARLRSLKFTFEDDLEDELSAFYDALECNIGQKRCETSPYWFLADLIEPEPERTCTVTRVDVDRDGTHTTDYSCGCFNNEGWNHNYCPNCGAKVVEVCSYAN